MKRHTEADASEEDGQGEGSAAILGGTKMLRQSWEGVLGLC